MRASQELLVAYINRYKPAYPLASLKSRLLMQGIPERDIDEAMRTATAPPPAAAAQDGPAPSPTSAELWRGINEPVVITSEMIEEGEAADLWIDFEKGISWFPKLTCRLLAANVLIFAWEFLRGALWSREAMVDAGALYRPALAAGEFWRLFTAMFLHGSFQHLAGNCVALYILGIAAEHAFGPGNMFALYMASGLAASLLSAAMHPGPAVGASGAIFGLLAGVVVFMRRHQDAFVVRNRRLAVVLFFWAVYEIGQGFLVPYVDNAGHLGGVLGGLAFVHWLKPEVRQAEDRA